MQQPQKIHQYVVKSAGWELSQCICHKAQGDIIWPVVCLVKPPGYMSPSAAYAEVEHVPLWSSCKVCHLHATHQTSHPGLSHHVPVLVGWPWHFKHWQLHFAASPYTTLKMDLPYIPSNIRLVNAFIMWPTRGAGSVGHMMKAVVTMRLFNLP